MKTTHPAALTRGYAALSATEPLRPFTFERRLPRADDVVVDIAYCGVCHTDVHLARNAWGTSHYPMVPGHEITGVVSAVGAQVTRFKVGDRVGVGCFVLSLPDSLPLDAAAPLLCAGTTVYSPLRLGAHRYFATNDPRTFEALAGTFDLMLSTVPS